MGHFLGQNWCDRMRDSIKANCLVSTPIPSKVLAILSDEGFDLHFCPQGRNQCSHQFLNWWQQLSTGQLHLDGFESLTNPMQIKIPTTFVVGILMAEDEGFEPPQTESESGVLPLH